MLDRQSKTLALRALTFAASDPNATILYVSGYAAGLASLWKWLTRNKISGFTYNNQTRRATHVNGGTVIFNHTEQSDLHGYSGYQVAYLFVDEYVEPEATDYLKCRVRSAKELKKPMGVYNYFGRVWP